MSPYRTAAIQTPRDPREGMRCCGMCHAAVGGCQKFVTWKTTLGRTHPAGASIDRPGGTPPIVFRNGQWHREREESDDEG